MKRLMFNKECGLGKQLIHSSRKRVYSLLKHNHSGHSKRQEDRCSICLQVTIKQRTTAKHNNNNRTLWAKVFRRHFKLKYWALNSYAWKLVPWQAEECVAELLILQMFYMSVKRHLNCGIIAFVRIGAIGRHLQFRLCVQGEKTWVGRMCRQLWSQHWHRACLGTIPGQGKLNAGKLTPCLERNSA